MSGPGDRTVARDALVALARSILVATGAPGPAALAVAESLAESDLVGHDGCFGTWAAASR